MPTKKNTFKSEQKQSLADISVSFGFHKTSQIREGERGIALKIDLFIFLDLAHFGERRCLFSCNIFIN